MRHFITFFQFVDEDERNLLQHPEQQEHRVGAPRGEQSSQVKYGRSIKIVTSIQLRAFEKQFRGQFGSGTRAVTQAIERAEANVEWMRKYYKLISDWFKEENKVAQEKEEQLPK